MWLQIIIIICKIMFVRFNGQLWGEMIPALLKVFNGILRGFQQFEPARLWASRQNGLTHVWTPYYDWWIYRNPLSIMDQWIIFASQFSSDSLLSANSITSVPQVICKSICNFQPLTWMHDHSVFVSNERRVGQAQTECVLLGSSDINVEHRV